jgi:hypothetical protein
VPAVKGRRSQKGFVSLQTLLILASFTLGGGVAVPVWMSRAAAPQGAVIASDMRTIAMVYAQELLESDESSVWSAPRPETAAALSASLKRPVVNQISHSTTIVGGDLPEEGEPAPAVWITASAEMSEQSVAAHSDRLIDLAGTIVVHVDGSSLEVYVVSESGSVKTL